MALPITKCKAVLALPSDNCRRPAKCQDVLCAADHFDLLTKPSSFCLIFYLTVYLGSHIARCTRNAGRKKEGISRHPRRLLFVSGRARSTKGQHDQGGLPQRPPDAVPAGPPRWGPALEFAGAGAGQQAPSRRAMLGQAEAGPASKLSRWL
jgi:hypothetical protein